MLNPLKLVAAAILLLGGTTIQDPVPLRQFSIDLGTVVKITCSGGSMGSGVYVAEGFIVTAHHVLDGSQSCFVNGEFAPIIYQSKEKDLAVIMTETHSPGNSFTCDGYRKGETYYAVGWAGGETFTIKNIYGTGVILQDMKPSGLNGTALVYGGFAKGMSGGPVFTADGKIVGIINAYSTRDPNYSMSRELKDTKLCDKL